MYHISNGDGQGLKNLAICKKTLLRFELESIDHIAVYWRLSHQSCFSSEQMPGLWLLSLETEGRTVETLGISESGNLEGGF